MKKFLKWSFILSGTLLGVTVLIVGFGIWASYETGKRLDIGYGVSTSPRLVRLEIGDKVFAIPQNHIWSREDWKGGKVQGVNMHALLPDFEPRTEANQHVFDKPGSKRGISLLLGEHNMVGSRTSSPSMTRQKVYERIIYDYMSQKKRLVQDFPGPHGLSMQRLQPSSSNDELYVGHKHDGKFYWVTCSPDSERLNPRCDTYIEYSEHVTINYNFPKDYLSKWETTDDGILNLVRRFEDNAKLGEQK